MFGRANELAVLRVRAGFRAMRQRSALCLSTRCSGGVAYSALSTITAASCAMFRGSFCDTLTFLLVKSALLIVLIAVSLSRVSCLGFGKDAIKFHTLGKADLSRPGNRFAAPSPAKLYKPQRTPGLIERAIEDLTCQDPSNDPDDMNISHAYLVTTNVRPIREEHLLDRCQPALQLRQRGRL